MAGMKGEVKYANYKTQGRPKVKGIRNKRSKLKAAQREAELAAQRKRQRKAQQLEKDYGITHDGRGW